MVVLSDRWMHGTTAQPPRPARQRDYNGGDPFSQGKLPGIFMHFWMTSSSARWRPWALAALLACGLSVALGQEPISEKSLNVQLLEFAKRGEEPRARKVLEAGAAPDSRNRKGETALYMFARDGNLAGVAMLLERGASVDLAALDKTTPLMAAASGSHDDVVRALLGAGADVRAVDQIDKTALIYAAAGGSAQATALLLDRGLDVNARYKHDLTVLMWAAGYGKLECIKLLLERGAEPNLRDDRGKTAADIAREQGYQDVAALLQ